MPSQQPKKSKCLYCGSPSYGVGCPYSSHRKHVHVDDSKKCVYCGSSSFGVGCPYNPFSRLHVHGVDYNNALKESLHRSFTAGIFLNRLMQPISECQAYKFGIVNDEGKKLRDPVNDEEKASYNPLDAHIFRLKRLIGEDTLALLHSNVIMNMLSEQREEKFDSNKYELEISAQNKVNNLINDFKSVIEESTQSGIPMSIVENMIIRAILDINEKN